MKKKLFGVLLCVCLFFGLTGCNSNTNVNSEEKAISTIEKYVGYLSEKDIENAASIVDFDALIEVYSSYFGEDMQVDASDLKQYFLSVEEEDVEYVFTGDIKSITKEEALNSLMETSEEDMEDYINAFDGYEFYSLECSLTMEGQTLSLTDIFFYKDGTLLPSWVSQVLLLTEARMN